MLVQTFLGRLVVVRRDRQQSRDALLLRVARQGGDFLGVVASDPCENRDAAGYDFDREIDDAVAFLA